MQSAKKQSILFILGLLVIHAIVLIPLFSSPGLPKTHDSQLHIARIAAYYKAFLDGHFPVRWAADLNYGYGTPLFIFYYPLPGYLGAILHFLELSFQTSLKILLSLSFLAAPLFFYLWVRLFISPVTSFISALFYGLAPYHLLDLYVRGAIGELFAFALMPLILLTIDRIIINYKTIYIYSGAIFLSLLILSHNAFSLAFVLILIAYSVYKTRQNKKLLVKICLLVFMSIILSTFFWLPALSEQKYTHGDLFIGNKYLSNFPRLEQLVYSPWGYGAEISKPGGLSAQIGPLYLTVILLSLFLLFRINKLRTNLNFWLIIFLISTYLSLPYSKFIWANIKLLQKFEFPWRFIAFASFAAAVIAGFVFDNIKNKSIKYLMLIILFISIIPMMKTNGYEVYQDDFYLNYRHSSEFGIATTIWTAGDPTSVPQNQIEVISGVANVANLNKKRLYRRYTVYAQTDAEILDNTLYYPGWIVLANDIKVPIQFQNPLHRGLITFKIPKGDNEIVVKFTDTKTRKLSNYISLFSIILVSAAITRLSLIKKSKQ